MHSPHSFSPIPRKRVSGARISFVTGKQMRWSVNLPLMQILNSINREYLSRTCIRANDYFPRSNKMLANCWISKGDKSLSPFPHAPLCTCQSIPKARDKRSLCETRSATFTLGVAKFPGWWSELIPIWGILPTKYCAIPKRGSQSNRLHPVPNKLRPPTISF